MGRNPTTGEYNYPDGTPGNPNQTIFSTRYNTFINDLRNTLNTRLPINMGGTNADDAAEARANLKAEVALQTVTNYDSHAWESGSFVSVPGATGAPNATSHFHGTAIGGADTVLLEAVDLSDGLTPHKVWARSKDSGVWGAWVIPQSGDFVKKSGDTMTGNLTMAFPSPFLVLNDTGASVAGITTQRNGVQRWRIDLQSGGETGSNTGSNIDFIRYGDAGAGAFLGTALHLERSTGDATFGGVVTATNGRLWGATDGAPIFKNVANTVTGSTAISGSLAGLWVASFVNNSAAASSGGLFTQIANDTNMSLAVLNAAGNTWVHALFGNGNYTCTGQVTCNALGVTTNLSAGASLRSGAGQLFLDTNGLPQVVFRNAAATTLSQIYSTQTGTLNIGWGTPLQVDNGGTIYAGIGIKIRPGAGGAYGSAVYNFNWTGSLQFWLDFTNQGTIQFVSDYRTKKDIADLPNMWETVKALRPIKYTRATFDPPSAAKATELNPDRGPMFEADDIERWGFIAHEMQDTMIPDAASGVKDAPDAIQSPNPWTIIAALTKALQEAMTRIEALEARHA